VLGGVGCWERGGTGGTVKEQWGWEEERSKRFGVMVKAMGGGGK
jgi:hypothetical protein